MYEIIISKQVSKALDKLNDDFVKLFWEKAQIISKNPFDTKSNLDITSLKGRPKGFYRLRIGSFRFLYEIRKREIIIYFFKVDTRGDVYKK